MLISCSGSLVFNSSIQNYDSSKSFTSFTTFYYCSDQVNLILSRILSVVNSPFHFNIRVLLNSVNGIVSVSSSQ